MTLSNSVMAENYFERSTDFSNKEFKNKCIDIRNKIQDELDKKYGKNKKFALGIGTDDMRKANLITPEMEARMQEIRKEVV